MSETPVEVKYKISDETLAEINNRLVNEKLSFNVGNIELSKFKGIYAIWWSHKCLYVGKSDERTVHKRLSEHLANCHNQELRDWIEAKNGLLKVSFVNLEANKEAIKYIHEIEAVLIKLLSPELNKTNKRN